MITRDHYFYRATVRMREHGGRIKTLAKALEGKRLVFMRAWQIDTADPLYGADEHAMEICASMEHPDDWTEAVAWLASGDLAGIEPIPFDEGMEARRAARQKQT